MSKLLCIAFVLTALPALSFDSTAQSTSSASKDARTTGTAIISGRVTVEGKAAAGVTVAAATSDYGPERKVFGQSVTDADGHFRLTNIPAGRMTVQALAEAFVLAQGTSSEESGKTITVAEGETIENLEFTLARGGVVTGRVTQSNGQPVIGEHVSIALVDEAGKKVPSFYFNPFLFDTDDRGVYRVYGLRAGRYLISVGQTKGTISMGNGGRFFPQTFHPGVTDEAKATIVEVTAGGEATGVDITLDPPKRTYVATGRIVNAETGKPVPDVTYGYGTYSASEKRVGAFGFNNTTTNAKGEFRIEGLLPDQYAAFAFNIGGDSTPLADSYSDSAIFEITDANVTDLEIKLHRGATISGIAVLENPNDKAALAQLSKLQLNVFNSASEIGALSFRPDRINADGSFLLKGLRPGKTRIALGGYPPVKGFSLVRVERNGTEQQGGIDVGAGEQINGVRLVLAYGRGAVRGQVEIKNGAVPAGARLSVTARRAGDDQSNYYGVFVDERNRFLIEGMPPGTYELTLKARIFSVTTPPTPPRDVATPVKQTVTVTDGAETQATFTLDLSAGSEGKTP